MRLYITGANSYLGGHLIPLLEEKGHEVIGLDSHAGIVHISKSISAHDISIEKCHTVIPLGWYSVVGDKHPELQEESLKRVKGLIEYLDDDSLRHIRVVFPSTAAVYGNHKNEEVKESSVLLGSCEYSRAKLKAEKCIQRRLEGRHIIFRFGSLMGLGYPGERTKKELVVNAFSIDGFTKHKIDVWNPYDWKPVIHVQDAARLILWAIEFPHLFRHSIYNACVGSATAIDLAKIIARITGANIDIVSNNGAQERSCKLSNRLLSEDINTSSFRKVSDTVREFMNYSESPNDRNTPWGERVAHGLIGGYHQT